MALPLLPESDVRGADGRWEADRQQPWLSAPGLERLAGRWVLFAYRQGLLDEAVRPIVRFRLLSGGEACLPLTGTPCGTARWIGQVPEGTVGVAFCPARRTGPFEFELLEARSVPRARLVARGLLREPALTLTAIGARLIGARAEARHCLAFAAATPPALGTGPGGGGMPAVPDGPLLHVVARAGDPALIARTRAALSAQPYPRWRLWEADDETSGRPVRRLGGAADWLAVIGAGDSPPPAALSQVAAVAVRDPRVRAIVGDEMVAGVWRPRPDWSPLDGRDVPGAFVRLSAFPPDAALERVLAGPAIPAGVAAAEVATLHRTLWLHDRAPPSFPQPPPDLPLDPIATVVVPFRDRPALLAACLAGLDRTAGRLELILVDNGSTDGDAIRLADEAARAPGTTLLRRPGPFNYAALCNAGAAAGTAPLLLFLNNDVEPREPDWLRRLAARAVDPGVGAVGARLLFPDGRLQHGGVAVGMGGTALHPGRGGPDRPDPLGLLDRPRRVGAVTGAVLMVERAKFEAVGGFDADSFPVLLNDIDLCLRLAARGWNSFYEPAAILFHRESASRGRGVRPLAAHSSERERFQARWAAAIRHDPGFHPALSLWSIPPARG